MDISVVIPVYGSEHTLPQLTERLCAVLDGMHLAYEIVFVNDDSPDGAWQVIKLLRTRFSENVIAVALTRNFGQHNALMCGFREATGDFVITMDDDLQHPPEEIPKLVAAIKQHEWDVVYGRYASKRHRAWRNLGSTVLNAVYKRVFSVNVDFTAFRIIRRSTVEAILAYDLNFTFIDGLLAWNTRRISGVDVVHAERAQGRSGYSLSKLLVLSFNLLTNFSLFPLQLASITGLLASVSGFAVGIYYLVCAFIGNIAVPGYASLITAVLFLGGIQLLATGIIGEYVGRLHLSVSHKPQYRIRERLASVPSQPRDETITPIQINTRPKTFDNDSDS